MDIGAQVNNLLTNWPLVYLACGILFGILFVFWFVNLIDIHAQGGSFGFRLMILPTSIILWPLILILFITRISTIPKTPLALKAKQSVTKEKVKKKPPDPKPGKTKLVKNRPAASFPQAVDPESGKTKFVKTPKKNAGKKVQSKRKRSTTKSDK